MQNYKKSPTPQTRRIKPDELLRPVKCLKHINNALTEELDGLPTVAYFATVQIGKEIQSNPLKR